MPQTANETVTLKLPSGESVDALVPAGMSDEDVQGLMKQKHPEFFSQSSQSNQPTDHISQPPGFLSRFRQGAEAGMGGENALNSKVDPQHPISTNPMIPGAGVYRDIKGGNYAGALGRIAGPAAAIGSMFVGGAKGIDTPSPAPGLLREAIAADAIPRMPMPDRIGAHLGKAMEPSIAGNATLDLAPRYPGAPLPEKPAPELLQANAIGQGGKPIPPHVSSALGKIATHPEAPSIYPGANLPEKPPAELLQSRGLSMGGRPTPEPQSSALGQIKQSQILGSSAPDISRKNIEGLLDQGLGGKPLMPNVPLKQQGSRITGPTPQPAEGMRPVDSTAIKSYRYDQAKREFEVVTTNDSHIIHGDVSPEQAKAFESAPSKGKAWSELKNNSTYVGKVVNGQRVYVKPPMSLRSADPNDLTETLEQSVAQAKAKKKSTIQ